MEKLYSEEVNIFTQGKNLEDMLYSLNVPCLYLEGKATPYSAVYYYKLKDAIAITRLPKVIPALEVLLSAQAGEVAFAPTPTHPTAHFCLTVENRAREINSIKDYSNIIKKKSNTILYGIDIASGELVYSNLTDTPHLLIAGASGSGKSVLLHNIIASLCLLKPTNNTSLVLIDTKQVEFADYEHADFENFLACPIAHDVQTAINTLRALCNQIDIRYGKMREKGLKEYDGTKWVVVIDEFADLMLAKKSIIEPLVVRIAQMGRACGVHLIIATQRPSVDVCTGLIKANIPDRVALRCASIKDSIVILDKKGAETLKGKGEALIRIGNNTKKVQCFNK